MNTPNLDVLIVQARQQVGSEAEHVERVRAITKMERLFGKHGPAMVEVLHYYAGTAIGA